jgi:hypothetical protein
MKNNVLLKNLNSIFGSYRAEWLKEKIFDFFAEPSYFNALQDNRPCVLEGGRGTGKTTVLRGLSYQGQFALLNNQIQKFDDNDFIGIYQRVDTNHVRAFLDEELPISSWRKLFSHYLNLVFCREILRFVKWHSELNPEDEALDKSACKLLAKSINIEEQCENQEELLEFLDLELEDFQSKINNIGDGNLPKLSLASAPIKIITEKVIELSQFSNKIFYLILDEYENFEDYQQQVVNTLVKHNTEFYTFKIGVREMGWRIKHTLNSDELLHDPADYVLIPIEQKLTKTQFSEFAKNVCEQRIKQLMPNENWDTDYLIETALGNLSIEDEAMLLEVEKTDYYKKIVVQKEDYLKKIEHLHPLYKYFISYWSFWHKIPIEKAIDDYSSSRKSWDTRYGNYKYEMLFKIRKGRGKSGIQKYYSGWNTYLQLARGNIRYMMELVYRAYEKHLESGAELDTQVDVKLQTYAAQEVGQKNLKQLEDFWKNGAKLTKLLLGFGRIFQILSSEAGNFAPERNQFTIEHTEDITDEYKEIINAAVMHLALVRSPGNKLTDTVHTKDYLYSIHPIYSAFFIFSYRKKRRIIVHQNEFLDLINKPPKETINKILKKCNVMVKVDDNFPKQMEIFESFYND